MNVLKFGGSSVGSNESIGKVIDIVVKAVETDRCAVVFSAMKGVTDLLIEGGHLAEKGDDGFRQVVKDVRQRHLDIIHGLIPIQSQSTILSQTMLLLNELETLYESVFGLRELTTRSLDSILSYGELMISKIIAEKLASTGASTIWKDSRELIRTEPNTAIPTVDYEITNIQIKQFFDSINTDLVILPGFIASDERGITTTLGRGGGDYSASLFAAGLGADRFEIWTDVSGMMTADPKFVRNAKYISRITYQEAMELSHFGAKVIYPPTLQPAREKGVDIYIKNTFEPEAEGTLICSAGSETDGSVRGITGISDISILSLEGSGMVGIPGFSKRLFDVLSRNDVNVILITQASSEHSICVCIQSRFAEVAKREVDREFEHEILTGKLDPLIVENDVSIIAVVGDKMRHHSGISGKMFASLGAQGVNVRAIAQGSSERNISAVIAANDVRKAVNILHEEFFSDGRRQINLFVAGVGSVGSAFLNQVQLQKVHLASDLNLDLRIVGLANSKGYLIGDDELDPESRPADLSGQKANETPSANIKSFVDEIISRNLRNSIFIDITASPHVAEAYGELLRRSVAVVACNKIASSSEYENYRKLRDLAREFNTSFLFEANVGAGLPVINTLKDLMSSGDRIERIEGVLSGSLNYIFSSYDGISSFASVVRDAQSKGFTEPDPRADLSGLDVARKILILARESGHRYNLKDVSVGNFLPKSCFDGDVAEFFAELERQEDTFRKKFEAEWERLNTLRYVATFETGNANGLVVGPQSVSGTHDFAKLVGSENAIAFHTNRYDQRPLVVKGAGAGPEVTAAGVFADVIRAAR